MELNELLRASESCLRLFQDGQYDELQEHIGGYTQSLERYLRSLNLAELTAQQQSILTKINDNHLAAIDSIKDLKRQVRERIAQLRHGRQLTYFYDPR